MRPPLYDVAPGVDCIPPNDLPKQPARDRYVIVGGGKTSMDACTVAYCGTAFHPIG